MDVPETITPIKSLYGEGGKLKKVKFERLLENYPWLRGALSVGLSDKSPHRCFQYLAVSRVHDMREFENARFSLRRIPEKRMWQFIRWTIVYRLGDGFSPHYVSIREPLRKVWLVGPEEGKEPDKYKTVKEAIEETRSWYEKEKRFTETHSIMKYPPLVFMAVIQRALRIYDTPPGICPELVKVKLF